MLTVRSAFAKREYFTAETKSKSKAGARWWYFCWRKALVPHRGRADKWDLMVRSKKVIRFGRSDFFRRVHLCGRTEPEHLIQHELVRRRRFWSLGSARRRLVGEESVLHTLTHTRANTQKHTSRSKVLPVRFYFSCTSCPSWKSLRAHSQTLRACKKIPVSESTVFVNDRIP